MQRAMLTASYTPGDLVKLRAHFFDPGCSPVDVDPDNVVLRIKDPDGNVTAYQYGDDVRLEKESAGHYLFPVDTTSGSAGDWHWRWEGTGSYQAAIEGSFKVAATAFPGSP
jgi:hypothetical protein